MIQKNENKKGSDFGKGKESARVIRYYGTEKIIEMMKNKQYIEAFVHTQLGVEKILWDRILGIFEDELAIKIRQLIENYRKGEDKSRTNTGELIKWAHFLTAIDDNEHGELIDFNRKRNMIMHGHGAWYNENEYEEALNKGIRFLNKYGLH